MNNFIQIENRHGKLKLNERVDKDSADALIEGLEKLYGLKAVASNMVIGEVTCSADDALETVEVEINTGGGSVLEGQRIYNSLRGMASRGVAVKTVVNGVAASMGSVILMSGDERSITSGSRIMIHEASTIAMGDARDMQRSADLLESISNEIAEIYAERSDGSVEDIREMMYAETWMDASEAKSSGFVHSIIKNGKEETDNQDASNVKNSHQPTTKNKTMFSKDKDLVAKYEASQAEVAELEATITKREADAVTLSESLNAANEKAVVLEASLTEAKADIEEAHESIETLEKVSLEAQAETAQKVIELEAKDAELVTAKIVTDEAVSAKAAELFQGSTASAVADAGEGIGAESDEQLLAHYESISDKDDRRDYFAANKTKILRAKARLK